MNKSEKPDSHEPSSLTIEAIDQAIQKHQASIIQLQRSRNSLIPISRLPPEILGQIFVLNRLQNDILSDFSYTNPYHDKCRSWVNVTMTCHHWREVGIECPMLWSFWGEMSSNWCDAFISRSKAAPLHVRLSETFMPRAVMSMIQKLSGRELRNRIRELHISATSDVLSTMLDHFKDNEESEALNEPSPDIHCSTRSLRLLASYPSPLHAKPQLPETFSARQFPHLRYLQLAGCEFRLDSSIFLSSSLTHLSLRLNTTPYSLQLLTSVLTKHPQLTRLTIQFAAKTIIEADADLVNLPFLQEIKLSGQASACFALMARVSHGHLLKDTEITVGEIGRPSASIEPQILQFLERSYTDTGFTGATEAQPLTIRRLELQDGSMTKKIQFWDSPQKPYRYISTKPPPQHLCVTWTTYSPTLELQKLCTILPFDQLHTISLSGVIVGREAWVNLFGRMPSLVVLNFSGDGMAGPILAALRPSQKKKAESKKQKAKTKVKGYGPSSLKLRTHDVATTLLLPHLHQLVLEGVDFKEYNFYEGIGEEQALLQILQDALLERKAAGKDVEDCKSAKIAEVIEWDEEENIDKNGYEENCLYQDSEYDEYPYPDYYCAWFFFGLLHLQL